MEHQTSFAQSEYARKKKTTRRERFLAQMEQVVPWARLVALIVPHYPAGKRGRPSVGIERMLRLYFLQQWYALADEALEDALYDSQAMRTFAGIDLGSEAVPAATTLLKFRDLIERHDLRRCIFEEVGALLEEKHLLMREGTLTDATIIAAPCSTKNRQRERDPAMHQTKKGNQWYFGMKAHIGADEASGLVHSVEGMAANVLDIGQTHALLHGEEKRAGVDVGYTGVEKRAEIAALGREIEWRVAARRSTLKAQPESWAKAIGGAWEKLKALALVEHLFHIVKNIFRHRKARYRGLEKKHRATAGALRAGQPLHGAAAVDEPRRGLSGVSALDTRGVKMSENFHVSQTRARPRGTMERPSRLLAPSPLRGGSCCCYWVRWFPLADSLHHRLIPVLPPGPTIHAPLLITHIVLRAQSSECPNQASGQPQNWCVEEAYKKRVVNCDLKAIFQSKKPA